MRIQKQAVMNTGEKPYFARLSKDLKKNMSLYLLVIPVIAFYIIFCYKPIYGAVIAFKDFSPGKGIWGSTWVGLDNFIDFFTSRYFVRTVLNTLRISVFSIIFGFPAPIIFALLMNELKNRHFAKTVQTITYMPYFVSLVVICGIIKIFVGGDGIINLLMASFGMKIGNLLNEASAFVPIYIISDIWQGVGWGSIIYLAAIAGIDQQVYEAAYIDGAGRWKQTIHVTIPGIMPTIITLLILRLGSVMNVGFEKIILLYNPLTYETADVISSFVYRAGLQDFKYSFSTAVGLFNSAINFALVVCANTLSKKFNDIGLW